MEKCQAGRILQLSPVWGVLKPVLPAQRREVTNATSHSKLTAKLDQSPISDSGLREIAQHGMAMGKSLGSVCPMPGMETHYVRLSQVHPCPI